MYENREADWKQTAREGKEQENSEKYTFPRTQCHDPRLQQAP